MRLNEYMCHAHLVRIRQKCLPNGAAVSLLFSCLFISFVYLSFKYTLGLNSKTASAVSFKGEVKATRFSRFRKKSK